MVPAPAVWAIAPAALNCKPLIVCVVAVFDDKAAVVKVITLVVPAAAGLVTIAPPAILMPFMVPPATDGVKELTAISSPFEMLLPRVFVRVPVVIFRPSDKMVLPAKLAVAAGVVMLAPDQFSVPVAVVVVMAPAPLNSIPLKAPTAAVA